MESRITIQKCNGRLGKISDNKVKFENDKNKKNIDNSKNKLDKLQDDLKQAIKDERYEEAAKIRDEIKKKEGK